MSITYPPELLPSPDEGQVADVWVRCQCGCSWDPTMLALCPVCDQKEIKDPRDAEITKLKSQLEEARAAIRDYLDEYDAPVKDYALRTVLRNKLRALNGSAK